MKLPARTPSISPAGFLATLLLAACTAAGGSDDALRVGFEDQFVGGWDGSRTYGPSVLLLREGLIGTLSAVTIDGARYQYELSYTAEGVLTDDGVGMELNLSCSEGRSRPAQSDGVWSKMDCSGWELELICGLAGNCTSGDCNMVCDVVYFGDGYGKANVSLKAVEDQFDFWERV